MRLAEARASATTSVFLSHSHTDKDLVKAACIVLAAQGISVYVDWLDPDMPKTTTSETASRLRTAIRANQRFVLLSTESSLTSRWVPWELGFADGIGRENRIAILPVESTQGSYPGNEYLGLYHRIVVADSGDLAVFAPDKTNGVTLADWLRA
jgi:hypothetical protein